MFWNPAATAQFSGLNTESSYTLVLPSADVHVTSTTPGVGIVYGLSGNNSGDIGIDAVTSASYGAYQVSKDLWLGIAINSPFGLASKPENTSYLGSALGVTAKLLTVNANPTIAYRVAPGITVGVGAQIEWARGKLQFALPTGTDEVGQFRGDGWAFGATAGILIQPSESTSIGFGYRSQLSQDFEGHLNSGSIAGGSPASSTFDLPEIVTLSLRQVVTPTARLLGTVEWKNWSRFQEVAIHNGDGLPLNVPTNWSDGWFFSVGGEYDYTPFLTLRSGVAYEISPIDDPTKRILQIPDNDRVWLSIGASYKFSAATTIDVGYSHIFIQDGNFNRETPITGMNISGFVDNASVDLFSVGFRTHW
jgi:long-chain fatty acid transport protein